jgi:lipoprotein-releasing system permease protein
MAGLSAVPILARRFLLSKASDRFLSFIAWVSVTGVALGVLALVVVTSVINGFEGELVRVITGMNGDIVLYSRGEPVKDPARIESKIRKVVPETRQVTASFVTELMAAGPNGTAGAVLEGFDPETIGLVTNIPRQVIQGRLPTAEGEVALGSAIAERMGAVVGVPVKLIAPFFGDGASVEQARAAQGEEGRHGGASDLNGAQPRVVKAQVVGIVKMGMHEYDSKFIFATLGSVQKFLDQPGKVTAFKLRLAPHANSRRAADRLSDNFGYPFRAKDWSQMNKNLFYAIKLEKAVIGIILTAIVIVAAFNVISTLMMMIHDKTKEIAILKAMGFRPSQSFRLFCLIGMGIGSVGIGLGVLIGLAVNWVLARTRLIELPADVYYIGYLPVVVRWVEVGMIAVAALLVTFLATLYPAWKVSTRTPLEGLRYD